MSVVMCPASQTQSHSQTLGPERGALGLTEMHEFAPCSSRTCGPATGRSGADGRGRRQLIPNQVICMQCCW